MKARLLTLIFSIVSLTCLLGQAPAQPEDFLAKNTGLRFEENKGQVADRAGKLQPDILFRMKDKNITLFFYKDGISYQWHHYEEVLDGPYQINTISEATGEVMNEEEMVPEKDRASKPSILHSYRVDMRWKEANEDVELISEQPFADYNNYYLAHCPDGVTGVKSFAQVTYKNLYPNTDVVYYLKDGKLKYDVILHPGADVKKVQFAYTGAAPTLVDGKIRIETPEGFLEEDEPVAFVENERVAVSYKLDTKTGALKFATDADNTQTLVIDPNLLWGTYYGGTNEDVGTGTAVDNSNNMVYMSGYTKSDDAIGVISTTGSFQTALVTDVDVLYDAFLVKFNSSGVRQWATYYGGSDDDWGQSVAYSSNAGGLLYLGGYTKSSNLSTTLSVAQQAFGGGTYDGFLIGFSTSGTRNWATYYGGSGDDKIYSISAGNSTVVWTAGTTSSTSGISYGAIYQSSNNGGTDAFVAEFSYGNRNWCTYFGGANQEEGYSIASDGINIYLTGYTNSTANIATAGAYDTSFGGLFDAFVAKFNSGGSSLAWSTYCGGAGADKGNSVTYDVSGNVFVAGEAPSTPANTISTNGLIGGTTAGQQPTNGGGTDAFLVKFNSSGTRLWGTYYGGAGEDFGYSVSADFNSNVFLSGKTISATTANIGSDGYQNSFGGYVDAFLVKFNTSGVRQWGTYYGGTGAELSNGSSIDGSGNIYIAGFTTSWSGGIASGGHQNTYGGDFSDAFLAKFWGGANNPTAQPTALVFSSPGPTSLTLSYTAAAGSPTGYIVIRKAGSAPIFDPVDGTEYTQNQDLGGGVFVAYVGTGLTFNETSLSSYTEYYYKIYSYNGSLTLTNYLITSPLAGSAFTWGAEPIDQPTSMLFSARTAGSMTVSYTAAATPPSGYIAIRKDGSTPTFDPIDGTNYTVGATLGDGIVAYVGSAVSFSDPSLSVATDYYYKIYSYNGSGTSSNYKSFSPLTNSASTLVAKPTAQPATMLFTSITTTTMTVSYTAASGPPAGYIAVRKDGSAPTSDPVDGKPYTAGDVLGDGVVAYSGSAVTFNETTLTAGHQYFYKIYSYNGSGTIINYLSSSPSPLSNNHYTLAIEPSQASSILFNAQSGSSVQVIFTNGGGASRLILAKAGSPVDANPVDGTSYTSNSTFGSGPAIGSGNYIVAVGSLSGTTVVDGLLNAGSNYYFRVYEFNGSAGSENYNITTPTGNPATYLNIPSATVSISTTLITQSGFSATWGPTTGTTSYIFDVSSNGFGSSLAGYPLSVATNSHAVIGLSAATTYDYRIISVNATGNSPFSFTTSVLTIPATPVASVATSLSASGFTANWSSVTGATGYSLDVSANSSFTPLLSGYPKSILGNSTISDVVTGLSASTTYYYRVRSVNTSGQSTSSTPNITVTTFAAEPGTQASNITFSSITTNSITVNFTNGNGSSRLLVARSGSAVNATPVDGTTYTANSVFGTGGTQLGSGNYIVGAGSGSITVTGLAQSTTYHFQVFEFNGSGGLQNYNINASTNNPMSQATANPVATLTEIAAGTAPVISASVLAAGTTSRVLTGFSVSSSGSQTMSSVRFSFSGLSALTNVSLYKSSSAGSVGSLVATNASSNFTSLTENITTTVYYYLVVDVATSVNSSTGSIIVSPTEADIVFTNGGKNSLSIARNFTFSSSQLSDIIINGGTTVSITYGSFLTATGLTSGNSASLATFRIQDGGGSSDTDNQNTTLTAVTLQFSNFANLKRVAIFDGTSNLAELDVTTATLNFPTLSLVATDNLFKDFTVRATFKSTVTDKQFIQVSITSATASATGSGFAASAAATSASTNQIIVAANQLKFVQPPTSTLVNATMSPAVSVEAVDGNSNRDLDIGGSVGITSGGTLTGTPTATLTSGFGTYSNIVHTVTATGITLTTTNGLSLSNANTSINIFLTTEPSQITNLVFSAITTNSITVNFTNGNGSSRLLVAKAGSAVDSEPVDGSSYTGNTIFGSGGSQILTGNSGNYVVGIGSGPIIVTGLTPGVTYHFKAYEFNGAAGTQNYNINSSTNNPLSQAALATEPTAQATGLLFSSQTKTSLTLSYTAASPVPTGYIVLKRSGTAVADVPVDGTVYALNNPIGTSTVDYVGSSLTYVSSGTDNTIYYYAIFSYSGVGQSLNYYAVSPLTGSDITCPTTSLSSSLSFNTITDNSVTVGPYSSSSTVNYHILRRTGSSPTSLLVNGTTYAVNAILGDGSKVVYVGSSTSFADTGLTAATNYFYDVYGSTGTGTGTYYYKCISEGNVITYATEPVTQASNISFTSISSVSVTVNFTSGDGSSRLVLVKSGSAVNSNPADGTGYTANNVFGSGTQIGTGNYVAGSGSGITVTGLSANTTYHFRVYEFNGSGGSENYNISSSIASVTTLAGEPATQASNLTFSSINFTSVTVNFSNGSGTSRLLIAKSGSAVDSGPVDGTTYSANPLFASGTQLGTGNYVVGLGSGPITVSGLTQGTIYHFQVYEVSGSGGTENYNVATATGNPANQMTLSTASLAEIAAGTAPVLSSTTLSAGSTDQVLSGISIGSNGSQTVTSINFNIAGLASQLSNVRLFKATSSSVVGSSIATNASGNFTSLSETITSTVYYYLVADVSSLVNSSSSSIVVAPTESNIIFSTGGKNAFSISRTFNFSSSQLSDIILNGGATTSIDYSSFQAASTLTAGNSASLATFTLRDGASTVDADNLNTTLTSVALQFSNFANLRRAAIFVGTTNVAELDVTSGTVTFSGLTHVALDNGTKDFTVRGTFRSAVTDNQFIQVSISSATASSSGSGFAAADAGAATTGLTTNQITVVADKLQFATNPASTFPATNFSLTTSAVDGLGNVDADRTGQITLSASGGPGTLVANSPEILSPSLSGGTFGWTKLSINQVGTYALTAAYSGLTSASGTVVIAAASEPTTQSSNLTFSTVTPNSMMVNFTNGNGTSRLLIAKSGSAVDADPADGTSYSSNTTFGNGTQIGTGNYIVGSGSGAITLAGLSAATVYHFRVYEFNGSGGVENYNVLTAAGNPASQTTLSNEPTAQTTNLGFTSITNTSFNGTVTAASGNPDGYLVLRKAGSAATGQPVDAVTYSVGATLADGTVVFNGSASVFSQTSLSSNSTYFYSAFAFNGSGTNINYLATTPFTTSLLTLPDAPVAKPSSNNTAIFFDANWDAVSGTGTVTYQVDVSKDNFVTIVQNLSSLTTTTVRVNNLQASTDYQYRIRAINATGASTNSSSTTARTLDVGTSNPLKVNTAPSSNVVAVGFSQTTVTGNVSGGVGTRTVVVKIRAILSGTFTSIAATDKGNDNFEATITEAMLDDLGLEYYFEAADQTGTLAKSSGNSFIYKSIGSSTISAIPFSANLDGRAATYEMFSIPYVLSDKNISSIFDELGGSDKTKWRLFRYQSQGEKYIEYPDNITNIEIGKGYWFNAKEKVEIKPGAATVTDANQSKSFQISFDAGWNQIGNPYPFNIDWNVIKNANTSIGLNSLWLFEGGNYVKKNVLLPWKGAFVFSDNGGTVSFPVTAKSSASGRTNAQDLMPAIDEEAWQLPISISLNGLEQISGIGMHPEAKTSKDKFDEITIPRFLDYLEMDTYHEEFFAHHFASDVVPTSNTRDWLFTVSSNQESGEAVVSWDQHALFSSQSKIALLDLQTQTLVDMKTTGMYRFNWSEGRQFKILYSKEGELLPGITLLGNAYPNPFNTGVTIPFMLEQDQTNVEVSVYDLLGRRVKTISKTNVKAGIHNVEWNGNNEQGTSVDGGLYLYQLRGDKGIASVPKRLLKQ